MYAMNTIDELARNRSAKMPTKVANRNVTANIKAQLQGTIKYFNLVKYAK